MTTKKEEIKIEKGEKTIKDNFTLKINPYTILTGENNSGKTNLVELFEKQDGKNKINIIYFDSKKVELKSAEELSKTKKTSPFYKLLNEILKNEDTNLNEDFTNPINKKLEEISKKINENINFIDKHNTELKISENLDDDSIIKNLILVKILDEYWKEDTKVEIDEIGQGTQRMIIFALLKYYAEQKQKQKNNELNFFIIEEPEAFLHPKLKKEFNKVLFEISKKDNNQVLITTHDPYFIEMNVDEEDKKKIIALKRDEEGYTIENEIKEKIFSDGYISHAEINYRIFGIYTETFHNELYGFIQEKAICENDEKNGKIQDFDEWLKGKSFKNITDYIIKKKGKCEEATTKTTIQTFVRNLIHHPENDCNEKTVKDFLEKSTDEMVDFLTKNK